ncbi:MAG: hypothetical protein GX187_03250 [Clostridiaceae bacterium]|nr:hypothetical protein [Clostridiaceae bacterium]
MKKLLKNNNGAAIVTVVFIIAVVFLLCVALINFNDSHTKNVLLSGQIEDALQIAEAGYNHFMSYLYMDSEFYKSSEGISNPGPAGEELGFVPIDTDSAGYHVYKIITYRSGNNIIGHYQVRVKPPSVNEDLTLISTGWTDQDPEIKKSVKVKLHKRSFTEYVDFTQSSGTGNNTVYWTTDDVAYGPVFCNGDIFVKGFPIFMDNVYTAGKVVEESGEAKILGKKYENVEPAMFPVTNSEIKNWAENGGIYLEGRTCIFIDGTKLYIRNNHEEYKDELLERDLPKTGVVYVKGKVFISGILDGKLTVYATDDIYITGKNPTEKNGWNNPRNATMTGSITVDGYNYNIGIGYQNTNIPLDRNATGSNYSDDMLGLISEKNIIIATKTWPYDNLQGYRSNHNYNNVMVPEMIIYGAVMSTGGQFMVEDFDKAPVKGRLSVYGSKIQNSSRGAVGTFDERTFRIISGYNKQDRFDYRFKTMSPPHFVEPANSGWEIRSWEEIPNPKIIQ